MILVVWELQTVEATMKAVCFWVLQIQIFSPPCLEGVPGTSGSNPHLYHHLQIFKSLTLQFILAHMTPHSHNCDSHSTCTVHGFNSLHETILCLNISYLYTTKPSLAHHPQQLTSFCQPRFKQAAPTAHQYSHTQPAKSFLPHCKLFRFCDFQNSVRGKRMGCCNVREK